MGFTRDRQTQAQAPQAAPAPGGGFRRDVPDQPTDQDQHDRQVRQDYMKTFNEDTVIPGVHFARGMQGIDDIMRVGAGGLSLGLADKAAAGVNSLFGGGSYAEELAKQRQASRDAATRLDIAGGDGPISASSALDVGSSLLNPIADIGWGIKGASAVAKLAPKVLSGATMGGLSAYGHDQDVGAGAAFGGISPVLLRAAGPLLNKIIPTATGYAGGAGMSSLASNVGIPPWISAPAGWTAGRAVGKGITGAGSAAMSGIEKLLGPENTRALLARIMTQPGAQYGNIASGLQGQ
jgi:hypothetical protein